MNWNSFGMVGYLSVVMSVGTVALCLVHAKKPVRLTARIALLLAVLAFAAAKVNSVTHVNRIELDPAEQLSVAKAREEQRRQTALASRDGEVADIRFAEDAEGEYYDRAGMDEADLKYLGSGDSENPAWKKQKRKRGAGDAADDSLEGMIGAKESASGVDAGAVAKEETKPPVLMSAGDIAAANRLDRLNLATTKILMLLGLLLLAHDYIRRSNIYQEASLPLPLPGGLRNAVTPLPPVVRRPDPPRRGTADELVWLLKRGESFVYFADDEKAADEAMARIEPLVAKSKRADLIRVSAEGHEITDEFVFEALWHGRASFVVDDPSRVDGMLGEFEQILARRRTLRARASRPFHLVWDRQEPLPEALRDRLASLLGAAGASLFLIRFSSVS